MTSPLRIVLCGVTGRMGRRVAALAQDDDRFELIAGLAREQDGVADKGYILSHGAGRIPPVRITSSLPYHLAQADVLIDFTTPPASMSFAQAAAASRKSIVIGTTGFTQRQMAAIRACSRKTPVFLSPNLSLGMNLLFHLAERAAAALRDYDVSILEVHHTQKKDAPSGTALRLAEAVRRGQCAAPAPVAHCAAPRSARRRAQPKATVPIVSQRLGTVVGEHTLSFAGPHERVELVHRAESRDAFARGALEAALWVAKKRPGLYDMRAMLGLT